MDLGWINVGMRGWVQATTINFPPAATDESGFPSKSFVIIIIVVEGRLDCMGDQNWPYYGMEGIIGEFMELF
jgi:hypothetical protein